MGNETSYKIKLIHDSADPEMTLPDRLSTVPRARALVEYLLLNEMPLWPSYRFIKEICILDDKDKCMLVWDKAQRDGKAPPEEQEQGEDED